VLKITSKTVSALASITPTDFARTVLLFYKAQKMSKQKSGLFICPVIMNQSTNLSCCKCNNKEERSYTMSI